MSRRLNDLFDAHLARKLGRRELMDRVARLGLGGVAAGFLLKPPSIPELIDLIGRVVPD